MGSPDARWQLAVDELAGMPDLAERLAEAHHSDDHGHCVGCTRPGVGTAHVRWPCGLYRLATEAIERPTPASPNGSAR
jgi:hypothetical protein